MVSAVSVGVVSVHLVVIRILLAIVIGKLMMNTEKTEYTFTKPKLLTPNDVAVQLKVTSEQIRCLIRSGQLTAINVGIGTKRPLYRITKQALENFLNRRYQPSKAIHKRKFKQLAPTPDFFPGLK